MKAIHKMLRIIVVSKLKEMALSRTWLYYNSQATWDDHATRAGHAQVDVDILEFKEMVKLKVTT